MTRIETADLRPCPSHQPAETPDMPNDSTCDVTLCIVNTNNRELLRRCLETIVQTVHRVRYEVIVVDNASDDGSAAMVAATHPHVRLLVNPARLGYGASHNRAISCAAAATCSC